MGNLKKDFYFKPRDLIQLEPQVRFEQMGKLFNVRPHEIWVRTHIWDSSAFQQYIAILESNDEGDSSGCLYRVERLHKMPALMKDCCDLINMEWKRSLTARMRSIEGSCEDFPMSLLLLGNNEKTEVIGHCKITKLGASSTAVFVETVVIHPGLRGKGLGKFLMNAAEKICKSKNVKWIYLTTMGQEGFYEKLGYTKCAPISIYGCQFNDPMEDINETEEKKSVQKPLFHNSTSNIIPYFASVPPPPPPPPAKMSSRVLVTNVTGSSKRLVVALENVNGAKLSRVEKMKDYTTNNYCDFLWINELLQLKKGANNAFTTEVSSNRKSTTIAVSNVIIFGTIIEVKQIKCKGYLYQIDDGTGVIACKHSGEQFEELISVLESEQSDSLNEISEIQQSLEQSIIADTSADDSVFNDRSIQLDEIILNKKSRLKGVQSIWDDIYASFNSLIGQYDVGDSVIIHGRLYGYFNLNQIYINSIRKMDLAEEIMQLTIKLEDSNSDEPSPGNSKMRSNEEKRFSGLMTFDNIQQLNPTFSLPGNIRTPDVKGNNLSEVGIVTPNLEATVTFDTFAGNR